MKFVIEHLEKHFDKKVVLKDINFTFEEGKSMVFWDETVQEKPPSLSCSAACMSPQKGVSP